MVCKNLSSFVNDTDTNNDKIGSWAVQVEPGVAKCKACEMFVSGIKTVTFKQGKAKLLQHSGVKKHQDAMKKYNHHLRQTTLSECLEADTKQVELKSKIKMFEIDLTRRLDSHNISKTSIDCIVDCIQTHLSGHDASKIVQGVKLKRHKSEYLAKYGIAETYLQETIDLLQNCDAFAIGFDESEINKRQQTNTFCKVEILKDSLIVMCDKYGVTSNYL